LRRLRRPVHLSELYAKLLRTELSPRTVNHVHRLLHQALSQAGTWELVKQNVASLVEAPRAQSAEVVILTAEQVATVLKRVEGRTLRPIVALALATGARRGELLALRVGDFEPNAQTIRIERSLEQTKSGLRIKAPKTKHGRRTIALPPSVATELKAYLLKLHELRLSLGMGRASNDDLLFPRFDGKTRSPHWLTQKFALLMEALKISGVTFHSLRHTHASQLIASGMDVHDHAWKPRSRICEQTEHKRTSFR
jgi:integrase